jgi:hypothetical protein
MRAAIAWGALLLLCLAAGARAEEIAPPLGPAARDTPDDGGRSVDVSWQVPAGGPVGDVVEISRVASDGASRALGRVPLVDGTFVDGPTATGEEGPVDGVVYRWRLTTRRGDASSSAVETGPASSSAQLFHHSRMNILIILSVIATFVLVNVGLAARGDRGFFIRRLAPVDAMDEAIGRATEMGRSVLYVPGIEEVDDIQTIASMLILERVAEKTATYDVPLEVPTRTPFVLAVADEVVKNGCAAAGRPDAYRPDGVRYISSEQFAYCAGVNGMILRDRPAANLYLGKFYAESLIFAETGFAAGSIQIAGTAEVTQLPFFIAACDYTLIGEEFFAASAYLSRDPSLLSTIRAADWAKIALVAALVVGAVLESLGMPGFHAWFRVH